MAEYDQLTRDLARKAADDATSAIHRTAALHDDIAAKAMIATMAAGQCLAIACAFISAKMKLDGPDNAEVIVDALWEQIRPIAVVGTREAELQAYRKDGHAER